MYSDSDVMEYKHVLLFLSALILRISYCIQCIVITFTHTLTRPPPTVKPPTWAPPPPVLFYYYSVSHTSVCDKHIDNSLLLDRICFEETEDWGEQLQAYRDCWISVLPACSCSPYFFYSDESSDETLFPSLGTLFLPYFFVMLSNTFWRL